MTTKIGPSTLANTAVTAGTYGGAATVGWSTVDAQGRITTAGQQDIAIPSTQITDFTEAAQDASASMVTNGTHTGITAAYDDANNKLNLSLNTTGVTIGTWTKVTVDTYGRVTAGTNLTSTDITSTLGYTPLNKAGDSMSGPITLSVGALNGPSLNFSGSSLTGLYSPGTDSIAIVTNGVARQRVTSTGRTLFGTGSDNNVDLVQVFGNIKANDPTNSSHVATKNYVDTSISNAIAISTTDDVDEGYANLYYTDTRVRNALSVSGNLTYNAVTGVFGYVTPNTDGITEGSTNKYYTDTRVRNALAVSGSGLSYNNTNGTFSVNSTALATPNTIVFRDVSGNFAANVITATLQGNASTATKVATARTIGITGDATWSTTFDGSANVTAGLTLATVNSAPGFWCNK
mgnify:CR=1 FL=1